jgi:hypothetical protein
MKSFATSWVSRWGVRLAAFGFVAAVAAYAAGDPKLPVSPGGGLPGPKPNPLGANTVNVAATPAR